MNKIIQNLTKLKEEQEIKLKEAQADLNNTKKVLKEETFKEYLILNQILEDNPMDIIQFIESCNCKCYKFEKGQYFVTDGCYIAIIKASQKEGQIILDKCWQHNEHCGDHFMKKLQSLINIEITSYCNKKRISYEKE